MKKICVILLAILLCMPVCFPAFADMGGPEMVGYTAKTKTETDYFDFKWDEATDTSYFEKAGTLPAGTELDISNEYESDGELYGYFYNISEENGVSGYVRLRDLSVDGHDDYPALTAYKQNAAVRLRVADPKGVTLYAGPSGTYVEIGVIPQGAELTVDTLDQDGYETGAWMFLTYGGMSGWAHCWLYDYTSCPMEELLPEGETGTLWVVKDNAVLKDKKGNDLITVPKGEKLTFDAFNRTAHLLCFYVTYQGKRGYFAVDDDGYDNVVASDKNDVIVYDPPVLRNFSAEVYAYPEDKTPVGTVNYQADETLKSTFLYYAKPAEDVRGGEEWFYVNKDGQSGWIKLARNTIEIPDNYDEYDREIPALYDPDGSQKIEVTAHPAADEDASTQVDTSDETAASAPETTEPAAGTAAAVSGRPLSPAGIIGVCVAAAGILALTAFVTLRLIRRKKSD